MASSRSGSSPAARLAGVRHAVRSAQDSRAGRWVAIVGLGSRAIVYGALAVLVLEVALHRRHQDTDQGSALAQLGMSAAGSALLVVLVAGVACHVTYRWASAWRMHDTRRDRIMAFGEGLGYLPFGYLAVAVLAGDPHRADQGKQYRALSGQFLQSLWGQVLVGIVGAGVVLLGGFFVWQGVRQTLADQFDFPRHSPLVRPVVLALGSVGSVGRGVIFALAGALVIYAAARVEPGKAGGLDSALDALARQPFGAALLVLAAAGFGAFAVFALAEAAWRDT